MNPLIFKTNVNCANCVRAITPFLNREVDIVQWSVDTGHPDRLLTVEGEVSPRRVIDLLAEAGFRGEALNPPSVGG